VSSAKQLSGRHRELEAAERIERHRRAERSEPCGGNSNVVTSQKTRIINDDPDKALISTSHVERQNLTMQIGK
jgi:hypothetical protein